MRRELESHEGSEAIQLLLDNIANAQKALPEAPDFGMSSADFSAAA